MISLFVRDRFYHNKNDIENFWIVFYAYHTFIIFGFNYKWRIAYYGISLIADKNVMRHMVHEGRVMQGMAR